MGKLYGYPPHKYFEIVDNQYLNAGIDLACASGYWEDENYQYKKSQETAQNEAGAIDTVLDEFRKAQSERG